jgi:nucleotide-binding universal stress UspA family protein
MIKRILIPVDFSDPSLRAVDYAAELARRRRPKPRLIVLHVVEPVYYPAVGEMYGVGLDLGSVYDEIERAARTRVASLARSLRRRGVTARGLTCLGTAAQAIVDTAAKLKADLIVLSTHGRTGLSHVVMGSVAERVVRTAPCAVVTVRAAARSRRATAARRAGRYSSAPKSRARGRRRSAREA